MCCQADVASEIYIPEATVFGNGLSNRLCLRAEARKDIVKTDLM